VICGFSADIPEPGSSKWIWSVLTEDIATQMPEGRQEEMKKNKIK
jgi:hypothetical protein